MKNFFKRIINFLESVGRTKAAAELSRQGYYKEASRLVNDKTVKA